LFGSMPVLWNGQSTIKNDQRKWVTFRGIIIKGINSKSLTYAL